MSLLAVLQIIFVSLMNGENLTFIELNNLALPTTFSSGIAFIYNNKLNLIGGRNSTAPKILILNKQYSLDLSSISFITDNNGNLEIDSSSITGLQSKWDEISITYPSLEIWNYSVDGLEVPSQQSTVIGDRLYIVCPSDTYSNNDLLIFDLRNNAFLHSSLYSESLLREAVETCVVNNDTHLFAIGGWRYYQGTYYHNLTQIYVVQHDRWEYGGQMNQRKGCMGCAMNKYGNNIYIFGGYGPINGQNQLIKTIERYNVTTDEWNMLSIEINRPTYYTKCVLDDITNQNLIYCMGGIYGNAEISKSVTIFDANTETLTSDMTGLVIPIEQQSILTYKLADGSHDGLILNIGGYNNQLSGTDMIQYKTLKAPNDTVPTPKPTSFPTYDPILFNLLDYNITLPHKMDAMIAFQWNGTLNVLGGRQTDIQNGNFINNKGIYSINLNTIDFDLHDEQSYYPILNESFLSAQLHAMDIIWNYNDVLAPSGGGLRNYDLDGYICEGQCYATLNEFLYIFAAVEGVENDDLLIYNMETNQFSDTNNYDENAPRFATGACVAIDAFGEELYVTGGYHYDGGTEYRNFTQIYNINVNQWRQANRLNAARGYHGCAFNANYTHLYAISGRDNINFLESIEKYDIANDQWITINVIVQTGVFGPRCVLDDIQTGYIFCMGGVDWGTKLKTVNILDPETDTTRHNGEMIEDVSSTGFLIYNIDTLPNEPLQGILMLLGGENNAAERQDIIQYLGLMEVIDSTVQPSMNPTATPITTTYTPSSFPTFLPSSKPSQNPTTLTTVSPSRKPTSSPTEHPSIVSTEHTSVPTLATEEPSNTPTGDTGAPSLTPTVLSKSTTTNTKSSTIVTTSNTDAPSVPSMNPASNTGAPTKDSGEQLVETTEDKLGVEIEITLDLKVTNKTNVTEIKLYLQTIATDLFVDKIDKNDECVTHLDVEDVTVNDGNKASIDATIFVCNEATQNELQAQLEDDSNDLVTELIKRANNDENRDIDIIEGSTDIEIDTIGGNTKNAEQHNETISPMLMYTFIGAGILSCCVIILCCIILWQWRKLKKRELDKKTSTSFHAKINSDSHGDDKQKDGPGFDDVIGPSNTFEIDGESEDDGGNTDKKPLKNEKPMDAPIHRDNTDQLHVVLNNKDYVTPKPPARRQKEEAKHDDIVKIELQNYNDNVGDNSELLVKPGLPAHIATNSDGLPDSINGVFTPQHPSDDSDDTEPTPPPPVPPNNGDRNFIMTKGNTPINIDDNKHAPPPPAPPLSSDIAHENPFGITQGRHPMNSDKEIIENNYDPQRVPQPPEGSSDDDGSLYRLQHQFLSDEINTAEDDAEQQMNEKIIAQTMQEKDIDETPNITTKGFRNDNDNEDDENVMIPPPVPPVPNDDDDELE